MSYTTVDEHTFPFMTALGLIVCLFFLLSLGNEGAEGHSKAITECSNNILYKQAAKMAEDSIWPFNNLYVEHYDTNNDGKIDIETLSPVRGDALHIEHLPNPTFWIVDKDLDGLPDVIYIDKGGLGKCDDIVLYEDLNLRPSSEERPPVESGKSL